MNETYFSIFSQKTPVNQDINVVFTPLSNVVKYTYRVYNNDILVDINTVESNLGSRITLNGTGRYIIKIETYDRYNNLTNIDSGIYLVDKEAPVLNVGESVLELSIGDHLNVMSGVIAKDNYDGDITSKVTTNIDSLDLGKSGLQKLIYTVTDSANNTTTKVVTLNILKRDVSSLLFVQFIIIICLLAIMIRIVKYKRSLNLERRFGKYSVLPVEDKTLTLMDKCKLIYIKIIKFLNGIVSKSYFLTKYSNRFDKYLIFYKDTYESSLDIVSSKIVLSFVFFITAVISKAMQYEILSMYEMCLPIIIGFFVPDILFVLVYKIYREKLENDLLQAIIIMNNAFKSGRSIVQAIEMVGTELHGPMAYQFRKMQQEIAHGLSIDVVFKRFADRIDIEEVNYLTASLTILNKTGGNIIKVFSSIEHSLFMKKKLRLELKSLTGSSKIIVNILFAVPIGFVILISVISPGYFMPFLTNPIGIGLLVFMLMYYGIYVIFVRKILRVRM